MAFVAVSAQYASHFPHQSSITSNNHMSNWSRSGYSYSNDISWQQQDASSWTDFSTLPAGHSSPLASASQQHTPFVNSPRDVYTSSPDTTYASSYVERLEDMSIGVDSTSRHSSVAPTLYSLPPDFDPHDNKDGVAKHEPVDERKFTGFVFEEAPSAPPPAPQRHASEAQIPLRATHAPAKMRKMMNSFRMNPFAIQGSAQETAPDHGPLPEPGRLFEWQLWPEHPDASPSPAPNPQRDWEEPLRTSTHPRVSSHLQGNYPISHTLLQPQQHLQPARRRADEMRVTGAGTTSSRVGFAPTPPPQSSLHHQRHYQASWNTRYLPEFSSLPRPTSTGEAYPEDIEQDKGTLFKSPAAATPEYARYARRYDGHGHDHPLANAQGPY